MIHWIFTPTMIKRKVSDLNHVEASAEKRIATLRPLLVPRVPVTGKQVEIIQKINTFLEGYYNDLEALKSMRTVGGVEVVNSVFRITAAKLDLGDCSAGVHLENAIDDAELVPVYSWWDAVKARKPGDTSLLELIMEEVAELAGNVGKARALASEIDELMVKFFGLDWPEVHNFNTDSLGTSLPRFEIPASIFARGAVHLIRHQRQFLNFALPIFEDIADRLDKTTRYYQKLNVQLDQQDDVEPGTPVGSSVELE